MEKIKPVKLKEQSENQNDKITNYRWLVLFAYWILAFSNVFGFASYGPIWSSTAVYYNISTENVQWFTNMYYMTYFAFSPFANKPLQLRFDIAMYVSAILSSLGAWIVWIGGQSFWIGLTGFFILGVSEAIYMQVPVYLAELYFSEYQRVIAICLGCYATLAGVAFSFTYASFEFFNIFDQHEINQKIDKMNLMVAILNTVAMGICLIVIRKKNQQLQEKTDTLLNLLKKSLFNEENILDLLAFSVFVGIGWCYITIVSLQLTAFGFDQSKVCITGIVYQASGVFVGFWVSLKLDSTVRKGIRPDYDYYIKIITMVGFLFLLFETFLISRFDFILLLVFNFFIGVGFNTIYPLAMAAYCEKLFPLHSLWASTLLLILGNFIGFVLNYIIILPVFLPYSLWICLLIVTPFQLYFLFVYKTKYRRFELI